MRLLHVGGELGDLCEMAAMRLLRLGAGIGYMGGHRTLALPFMPGIVYLVPQLTCFAIALYSRHIDNDYWL